MPAMLLLQQSIYDPGFASFGGGSSGSIIHPLVLGAVGFIAVLTFTLKRKYIAVPLLLGMLLIPAGQNIYIGSFHLFIFRLLILIGCLRAAISRPSSPDSLFAHGFTVLDKVFLVWAASRFFSTILLYGSFAALANQIGFLWDFLGAYFLFRSLIEDDEDVVRVVKTLAVVAVVSATAVIYEQVKDQNLFAFLGGIREIPETRNGRVRSQGIFQHALLSGAFGATTFCLFIWLWKKKRTWLVPAVAMVCCLVMAYFAATSTPLLALLGGLFALCLWPIREHMRVLRWALVISLVALHLVMKAPVWYLLAHIDLAGGSTGWDRAQLVDNFIRHFGNWFLIGTHDNVNWGYDMWDQCNQYVLEGENGGLIAFSCFIAMFCICFRWIGNARKKVAGDRDREWLFWILGTVLFSQTLAYVGIDYFDQMRAVWLLILATITASTQSLLKASAESVPEPVEVATVRKPWLEGKSDKAPQSAKSLPCFLNDQANPGKKGLFLPPAVTKR